MTVLLRSSSTIKKSERDFSWYSITGTDSDLDDKRLLFDVGKNIEKIFTDIGEVWWGIGKKLSRPPDGHLAHMPTAASYNSDFGQMLAWVKLTEMLAEKKENYIAICDDPWVFRQLSNIEGVKSLGAPPIWTRVLKNMIRGYLARLKLVMRNLTAKLLFHYSRKNLSNIQIGLFAYAHPLSKSTGEDAYFGNLMTQVSGIIRLIHTDGDLNFTKQLMSKSTASLHSWGHFLYCFSLIFKLWRPGVPRDCIYYWLIKRSISLENSGAAIAANAWQNHCQERCLTELQPQTIVWPWENHPWERELTRFAKAQKIKTIGYQHAVVGVQQFNPSPKSNSDGLNSIPTRIICSGFAYYNQLIDWDLPRDRLVVGGAFRFKKFEEVHYDPNGPIFVAASADSYITETLMRSIQKVRNPKKIFLIKIHPLYPKKIVESDNIRITEKKMGEQGGLSAVVYGTGASGLEGLLAGIPTFRIRPNDKVAVNVLPEGLDAVPFDLWGLESELEKTYSPKKLDWESIYSPVNMEVWGRELGVELKK